MRGPALNNCRVNLSARCRQMRALGGDCYNFASVGDGQITMLVGDASGKGIAAALNDCQCSGVSADRGSVYRRRSGRPIPGG
jgi:serine phosphatase RsbU (regulator of sigma subunit)